MTVRLNQSMGEWLDCFYFGEGVSCELPRVECTCLLHGSRVGGFRLPPAVGLS